MGGSAQETIINLISLFATLTSVAFIGVVVPPTTLFFWHPFTLSLSYGLLSIQGILIAYSKSSILEVLFEVALTKKRARFFTHMLIQYGCGLLAVIGFGIILIDKLLRGKDHFQSYHAIAGLIAVLLNTIQLGLGSYIYFNRKEVKQYGGFYRQFHRILAVLMTFFSLTALIFGMYSKFMKENHEEWQLHAIALSYIGLFVAILFSSRVEQTKER